VLDVLDTAGQEEYRTIAPQWVQKRDGFLLVYSIVDESSLQALGSFFSLIAEEYSHIDTYPSGAPPILLVGNKLDLQQNRKVPLGMAEAVASKHNAKIIEASAKSGENVEKTFATLVRAMRSRASSRGAAQATRSNRRLPCPLL
jgi:small GTP-binding protein